MQEWTVDPSDVGVRLDRWLVVRTDAGSRSRASRWLASGKVYLNGKAVDAGAASRFVRAGERIGVWLDRPGSARVADRRVQDTRARLEIIHEDAALVLVNKPAGLLVEPLPGEAGGEVTLLDLLVDRYRHEPRSRAYVVHRIDRDTSGLVLFARTPAAREDLKAQFKRQAPERVYHAVVRGHPAPARGTWRDMLAWDPTFRRQRKAHGDDARGKHAEATYRVMERYAEASLLEVALVTGKRNQIRVQAAMRKHPLVGERQYLFGAPPEESSQPSMRRQALHAASLGFRHPTSRRAVRYEAPEPADFKALIAALRGRASSPPFR